MRFGSVPSHESEAPRIDDRNSAHDCNRCHGGPEIGVKAFVADPDSSADPSADSHLVFWLTSQDRPSSPRKPRD